MGAVYLSIKEPLRAGALAALRQEFIAVPNVKRVELEPAMPQSLLVEFEPNSDVPMVLLERLGRHGLQAEVMYR